jgi:DNA mismatch endonuclease (patch repair protein)
MDHITADRRSENMRRIRGKDTSPEMAVRRLVHGMGYRYRLHVEKLPGSPDLVFAGRRKIILVHGCFWHRHPKCRKATMPKTRIDFWQEKFEKNVFRDRRNISELKKAGWSVLVIWECELGDSVHLTSKVAEFLRNL